MPKDCNADNVSDGKDFPKYANAYHEVSYEADETEVQEYPSRDMEV